MPDLPTKAEVLDPTTWTQSTPADELRFLEWLKADSIPGYTTAWMNDGTLRPSDLYCYLTARFGEPRGTMMLVRSPSSDNLFHWHFHVAIREGRFEALSSNRGTEFRVIAAEELNEEDCHLLLVAIRNDFARVAPNMKRVRDDLESWTLFINPYARLNRLVSEQYDELSEMEDMEEPPLPPQNVALTHKEMQDFNRSLEDWHVSLRRASELALSLEMLTPVRAEAFINLVIFTLANEDLRRDQRLYDARIRDNVDVRLRGLHQICRGFRESIDSGADEFKAFQTIMNRRNDVLHGNVDPLANAYDHVFFNGTIQIFPEEDLFITRHPRLANASLEPARILGDVDSVSALILYVLSCLDDEHQKVMERVMVEEHLGWRKDTGRVGVLFPPYLVVAFPGVGSPPEGAKEIQRPDSDLR